MAKNSSHRDRSNLRRKARPQAPSMPSLAQRDFSTLADGPAHMSFSSNIARSKTRLPKQDMFSFSGNTSLSQCRPFSFNNFFRVCRELLCSIPFGPSLTQIAHSDRSDRTFVVGQVDRKILCQSVLDASVLLFLTKSRRCTGLKPSSPTRNCGPPPGSGRPWPWRRRRGRPRHLRPCP